ncbi:LexA family protein [Methylobacterium thuringiense]|nr:S24 family peptidase [Methylobacterium thuringiense]
MLDKTYMAATLAQRVQARLDHLNLGPVEAATKGDLERTYIRDIVKPDGKKTVTSRLMPKLAAVLQTTAAYLNGETEDPSLPSEAAPSTRELITVPKVGRVEAGEFREVLEFDDSERDFLLEQADDEFPRARMFALDVVGDSMNRSEPPIPPGAVIICVDFDDTGLPLMDGMIVALERTRNGGLTREWSVKEVVTYDDRNEFQPRSTATRHETIVVYDDPAANDGVEVKVMGIVRRISTPVPRNKPRRR